MALIVEDGSVVAGAESYATVAFIKAYHLARGDSTVNDADDADVEAWARKATDYMMQVYRSRWKGTRVNATQALDWPRGYVYAEPALIGGIGEFPYLLADDIVPTEVQRACAELALRAMSASLAPDLTQGVISETIGPISTQYDRSTPQSPRYRAIDNMLAPYLKAGGGASVQLVRA